MLTGHRHLGRGAGDERIRDLSTGALREVAARRSVVDAGYLEASVQTPTRTGSARPTPYAGSIDDWPRTNSRT
jgi:hypothetical protein